MRHTRATLVAPSLAALIQEALDQIRRRDGCSLCAVQNPCFEDAGLQAEGSPSCIIAVCAPARLILTLIQLPTLVIPSTAIESGVMPVVSTAYQV